MSAKYRVSVIYSSEQSSFVARAPELAECAATGTSRREALENLEDEIAAQIATIRDQGAEPPPAIDELPADAESAADGQVDAKVSRSLHRELMYEARVEDVPLGSLVAELLAEALVARQSRGGRGRSPRRNAQRDRQGGPRGRRPRQGYGDLDDKATFLEYVRGLEQPRGQRRSRRKGRRKPEGAKPEGAASPTSGDGDSGGEISE